MDRVSIYEYDRKNRKRVVSKIEECEGQIQSWSFFVKEGSKVEFPASISRVFIDISTLFYNEGYSDNRIAIAELMLNTIQEEQPIFSILICGASGIGKTEVARLLHQKLAPDEPMIKINFGNYSAQDALNSLIGSPRGYVGCNKGELPDRIMRSHSKVILIDEFEKASKPVYNFFLQLLEDGKFTDSLGREYDLDKYIIVFTSNITKERIGDILPAELRSRFNYKCAFWPLSEEEKEQYVAFKSEYYLEIIKRKYSSIDDTLKASDIIDIDVSNYSNMRDINSVIMRQITNSLYEKVIE